LGDPHPESVTAGDTVDTLEGWVLAAESVDGGWLNIVLHHICDPSADPHCPSTFYLTPSHLDAFLDWLKARELLGTHVRTIGEVIAANPQPLLRVTSVRSRRNGTAMLGLYVGCSGGVEVVDAKRRAKLRLTSAHASHAGLVKVRLRANGAGRRALAKKGRLLEGARVTFTPFPGTSMAQQVLVKLKRPRS
jgi:hypothetical protein